MVSSGLQGLDKGLVTVNGTPYRGVHLDRGGAASLGPFPAGCYDGSGTLPTIATHTFSFCITAGQSEDLPAYFP